MKLLVFISSRCKVGIHIVHKKVGCHEKKQEVGAVRTRGRGSMPVGGPRIFALIRWMQYLPVLAAIGWVQY